jgi:hypothetical protein
MKNVIKACTFFPKGYALTTKITDGLAALFLLLYILSEFEILLLHKGNMFTES